MKCVICKCEHGVNLISFVEDNQEILNYACLIINAEPRAQSAWIRRVAGGCEVRGPAEPPAVSNSGVA